MSEHTAGRWIWSKDFAEIQDETGEVLIALLNGHPDYPRANSLEAPDEGEYEANARLLAAAPKLLEACKLLVECMEHNGTQFSEDLEAMDTAYAAIALAAAPAGEDAPPDDGTVYEDPFAEEEEGR